MVKLLQWEVILLHNIKISKKGFTLIELLAVITVLSIVMILVLTTGGNLFGSSKKNAFTLECKNLYKLANEQYTRDTMFQPRTMSYVKSETKTCGNNILPAGNNDLEYSIGFNDNGEIIRFLALSKEYKYEYNNSVGLKIDDIKNSEVTDRGMVYISCRTNPFGG